MKRISPRFGLDRSSRFDSLGVLGQNAVTQADKEAVLKTLDLIRTKVPFNSNTDIEETKQFVEAVLITLESANADNHLLGIRILSDLAKEIGQDKDNNQLPTIVDGLMRLGTKEWNSEALRIHQSLLAIFQGLRLFDQCQILCAAAIDKRQYNSALGFIQYLDQEACAILNDRGSANNLEDDRNPIIHYIGAIANAMAAGGESYNWAERRLLTSFEGDRQRLKKWCDRAISYYLDQRADFDTALHIQQGIISPLAQQANPSP